MPLRQAKPQVPSMPPQTSKYNPSLDFDLYDSKPNLNIMHSDGELYGEGQAWSDISSNHMILPKSQQVTNKASLELFARISEYVPKSLATSPMALLASLIILYLGSKQDTEKELKNLLQLHHKNQG